MQIRGNEIVKAMLLSLLCFSVLTLPYHLPKITENHSSSIVDAVSGFLYDNPFSSGLLMTVKDGLEINLVNKEFRFINSQFLLKDIEPPKSLTYIVRQWSQNSLPARSLPLFLFNRYLRI